ncbi:MAG: glycosyltransferase family 4 protein [Minisyncoccia bacterium]
MRILITTGLSATDIGGPAHYGLNLANEFTKLGHKVNIIAYGPKEKELPIVVRHLYFVLRIFGDILRSDYILTTDTYSVAVPTVILSRLFFKRVAARIGGDFLWESYVERTGEKITLKNFNAQMPSLSIKESIIFLFIKIFTKLIHKLAFNTNWQKDIWQRTYDIKKSKICVIKNFIPSKNFYPTHNQVFLWAGREIKLKNIQLLRELSAEFPIETYYELPHSVLQDKIKNCYAVILPSFSEVCPNFVLEAISYGKPFIMTRETGMKEVCKNGGIFVDPFDEDALKESIKNMLDSVKYMRYQKELKSLQPRSWRQVAEEFLSLCQ